MNYKYLVLLMLLTGTCLAVRSQAPGSSQTYGGPLATLSIAEGGTHTEASETIYIGPGTYTINGTWRIYSKFIVMDSTARIEGAGTLQIYNAEAAGGAGGRTFIDGNNLGDSIELNIVHNNATGMHIRDLPFPADLVSAGFSNKDNNSIYIGKDLRVAVNGADIWLDSSKTGNLHFDSNATFSNYSSSRMVITNDRLISHVIRDAGGSSFFFPVGIADGDYTPAAITGAGKYAVSVIDYDGASHTATTPGEKGMNRIWHLYGNTASMLTLYHNTGTNGASYNDANAYIAQYQADGSWSAEENPEQVSTGVHSCDDNNVTTTDISPTGASNTSFFSKSSAEKTTLPVNLISFTAEKTNRHALLKWTTAGETNNRGFAIEHSLNGTDWQEAGYAGSLATSGSSSAWLNYSFVHTAPGNGTNFYRLRIEDMDGGAEYSGVRVVNMQQEALVTVFPNPFAAELRITGLRGNESLQLFDAAGRLVAQRKAAGFADTQIDVAGLQDGVYILNILKADGTSSRHKLLKKHN